MSAEKELIYCRGCSYLLKGLPEPRCPECGRRFDPGNRRTYRTRPFRQWARSSMRLFSWGALVVFTVISVPSGWLYFRHRAEQNAMAKVKSVKGAYLTEPLLSPELSRWASKVKLDNLQTVEALSLQHSTFDFARTSGKGSDFEYLKAFTNLKILYLTNTPLTDAGLAHVKELTRLKKLFLSGTQVTDAGLAHVAELTQLEVLFLGKTQVTDAGLVHLKGLANLKGLFLYQTRVTDAGLAHLAAMSSLEELGFRYTVLTDHGLVHLKTLTNLQQLDVRNTKVTPAGTAELKKLLPSLQVEHP